MHSHNSKGGVLSGRSSPLRCSKGLGPIRRACLGHFFFRAVAFDFFKGLGVDDSWLLD